MGTSRMRLFPFSLVAFADSLVLSLSFFSLSLGYSPLLFLADTETTRGNGEGIRDLIEVSTECRPAALLGTALIATTSNAPRWRTY